MVVKLTKQWNEKPIAIPYGRNIQLVFQESGFEAKILTGGIEVIKHITGLKDNTFIIFSNEFRESGQSFLYLRSFTAEQMDVKVFFN